MPAGKQSFKGAPKNEWTSTSKPFTSKALLQSYFRTAFNEKPPCRFKLSSFAATFAGFFFSEFSFIANKLSLEINDF